MTGITGLTSDTGSSSTDKVTSDATLTLTGTEANAVLEYSFDGGTTWGTSGVPSSQGAVSVEVRQRDLAGNQGQPSGAFSYTYDTFAAATGVTLADDTGTPGDGITNDPSLSFSGTEANAVLEYSVNGSDWSTTYSPVAGVNAVQVYQTDPAGNVSLPSTTLDLHLCDRPPAGADDPLAGQRHQLRLGQHHLRSDLGHGPPGGGRHGAVPVSTTGDAGTYGAWGPNTPPQPTDKTGIAVSVEVRQMDTVGNASDPSAPMDYTFDNIAPTVTNVSVSQTTISDTKVNAQVEEIIVVTYNDHLDWAYGRVPALGFTQPVLTDGVDGGPATFTLDPNNSTWIDNSDTRAIYQFAYTLTDNGVDYPHVGVVTQPGTTHDIAGNEPVTHTGTDDFAVNTATARRGSSMRTRT